MTVSYLVSVFNYLGGQLPSGFLEFSFTLFEAAVNCLIKRDVGEDILGKNSELAAVVSGAVLHSKLRNLF